MLCVWWTRLTSKESAYVAHHEMIPTLLSIVGTDNELLYALDNPLYDGLQQSVFHNLEESKSSIDAIKMVDIFPELLVSVENDRIVTDDDSTSQGRTSQLQRTSMTLSWTLGLDRKGRAVVQDEDVIVLRCGAADDERRGVSTEVLPIVEAASIAQARATHQFHYPDRRTGDSTGTDMWTIPNLPSFLLRQSKCQFLLYKKVQPLEYAAVASVLVPLPPNEHTPFGIHIALTSTADRMLVRFATGAPGKPVAQYFKISKQRRANHWNHDLGEVDAVDDDIVERDHASTKQVTGESDTYTASDMCQAPANETAPGKFYPPGYLHAVVLAELEPNTLYEYKVGLETEHGETIWSSRSYSFSTALVAGDEVEFSYLVYGDQGCPKDGGCGEGQKWMATMATREAGARSIHLVGDLSYAQGAAHHWDAWLDMIEDVVARVPLMIGVGNHEYDHEAGGGRRKDPSHVDTDSGFMPVWGNFGNDSGGECGVPTAKRFTMPSTGNGVFWYSYDYGLVHTIVISSEHDLSFGSPQHVWLRDDLHKMARGITPWVVVEVHRPFYEGERYWKDNTVGVAMRLEVEDLLFDYHVDLVVAGHYHAYHRT
jgi:Calcineurin-like phosphoesterase/Purple acid Phosphatase, N-terminal domain